MRFSLKPPLSPHEAMSENLHFFANFNCVSSHASASIGEDTMASVQRERVEKAERDSDGSESDCPDLKAEKETAKTMSSQATEAEPLMAPTQPLSDEKGRQRQFTRPNRNPTNTQAVLPHTPNFPTEHKRAKRSRHVPVSDSSTDDDDIEVDLKMIFKQMNI